MAREEKKVRGEGKSGGITIEHSGEKTEKGEGEEIRSEWRERSEWKRRGGKMREEQREKTPTPRALKPLLCTVMSDSVCRVNGPKPLDGGSTQHKHKPKGRKTRAKPLYSAHTHTPTGEGRGRQRRLTPGRISTDGNFRGAGWMCTVGRQGEEK